MFLHISVDIIFSALIKPGERASSEDGSFPAYEHLSASGGRSDAEDHSSCPKHLDRPEAGY